MKNISLIVRDIFVEVVIKDIRPVINKFSLAYLKSAEVFNPRTSKVCSVGDYPKHNSGMVVCHGNVCGGEWSNKCLKFDGNSFSSEWEIPDVNFQQFPMCWARPSGEMLMLGGGHYSGSRSTFLISADGAFGHGYFELLHNASYSG